MTKVIRTRSVRCYSGFTDQHRVEGGRALHDPCLMRLPGNEHSTFAVTQDDIGMKQKRSMMRITAESMVQEVVLQHPQTVVVFNRYRLACPGCYISPYHTIADTAREYAISVEPLLTDLNGCLSTETA